MDDRKLSPLGREMIQGLRDFADALESNESLEKRFKVSEVMRCPSCNQIVASRFDSTGIARCFCCGNVIQRPTWTRGN